MYASIDADHDAVIQHNSSTWRVSMLRKLLFSTNYTLYEVLLNLNRNPIQWVPKTNRIEPSSIKTESICVWNSREPPHIAYSVYRISWRVESGVFVDILCVSWLVFVLPNNISCLLSCWIPDSYSIIQRFDIPKYILINYSQCCQSELSKQLINPTNLRNIELTEYREDTEFQCVMHSLLDRHRDC